MIMLVLNMAHLLKTTLINHNLIENIAKFDCTTTKYPYKTWKREDQKGPRL